MPDDEDPGLRGLRDALRAQAEVIGRFSWGALTTINNVDAFIELIDRKTTPAPPIPPPALRKKKAKKELRFELETMPGRIAQVGDTAVVYGVVTYQAVGSDGELAWWPYPAEWVEMQFQGKTKAGPGPHQMLLTDVEDYPVTLRAIVDTGKTEKLTSVTITSICNAILPADPVLRDLTCMLFSEGGSYTGQKTLDDRELIAVAWAIRNRYDTLARAQAISNVDVWDTFASVWFKGPNKDDSAFPISRPINYRDLLRAYQQVTGVDDKNYRACSDPVKGIGTAASCRRVKKCVEIVEKVFVQGSPEDPFKAQGDPDYPGVFYYKAKGNTAPHSGPLLPELTGDDAHFYLGIDPNMKP